MTTLKKSLGLWTAAGIGIGAIIGTGIFVLIGVAAGLAGPSVILSFLIAGFVALLTGLSASELSSFITETGASYIYTAKAFGAFPGFVVGWMKSFDYIIGASAVSLGFAAYLAYFVGIPPSTATLVAVGTVWPLFLMLLNLRGMQEASWTNNALVVLKVTALVLFIVVGGYYLVHSGDFSNYKPFFPEGIKGMLSGASIIFFAFIGFNTIAMVAEEVKDPEKNVHRAILISFGICTLLYIGVAMVAVGLIDWQTLGQSKAPLELALRVATSNPLFLKFVAVSALFATTSVIISSIIGASRALFAMARQGVIPGTLAKVSGQGIPATGVVVSGVVISLIVLLTRANLAGLASIFNFGTLLTFFFINASLLQLRRTMPDADRRFTVPIYPVTPLLGLVSCVALAFFLDINAIIAGIGWISVGVLAYILNKKRMHK
ncbi:MAG TPA: amino acid permease [Methanoregulaceae archaeon]|nr:amino acid permease [Methanoregulaceae archaeon]HPD09976.1 amino acid permease [Methanoregulaceae archaeon]HRT14979.1 amino acid permease [Methanoregulaceae archaeon]HRU30552.1 amino acid permease [Methanoregulaceae archaeon]